MVRRFIKRVLPRSLRRVLKQVLCLLSGDLVKRIDNLEYRSFNRRFYTILQITGYLVGAQIPGDYLEFGVFQGTTFIYAYKNMMPYFKDMRFGAFDSFEGLPRPKGIDEVNGYSGGFHENEFSCTEEAFTKNLSQGGVDLNKVTIVKGWFDSTLKPEKAIDYGVDRIAVAWIDCDLYESTVPILKFITAHLTEGTIIVFDDWRNFRNCPDYGQQRACTEWLEQNPNIRLKELFSFGWHGIVFTVGLSL